MVAFEGAVEAAGGKGWTGKVLHREDRNVLRGRYFTVYFTVLFFSNSYLHNTRPLNDPFN